MNSNYASRIALNIAPSVPILMLKYISLIPSYARSRYMGGMYIDIVPSCKSWPAVLLPKATVKAVSEANAAWLEWGYIWG